MWQYYQRFKQAFWSDYKTATGEQMLGLALVVAILLLQIKFGVVHPGDVRATAWSIVWPYVGLFIVLFSRHVVRTPYRLDRKRQEEIEQLTAEKESAQMLIKQLTTAPDIRGEILAVFWEAPKDEYGDLIPDASLFYVKLRLVNHNDVPCTVDGYHLWVEDIFEHDGEIGRGEGSGADAPVGSIIHPACNYADKDTVFEEGEQKTYIQPLRIDSHSPLERARKKEGWVTFLVRDHVPYSMKLGFGISSIAPWQQSITINVLDSLGCTHTIQDLFALTAGAEFIGP